MSNTPIRDFTDGTPLQNADEFVFERSGNNYKVPYEDILSGLTLTASQVTDFDTEVANNSAVALNTAKRTYPSADEAKLATVETNADVTDAANVNAAGATMNTDTDISGTSWVVDEDDMSSDSATKVPTQQSVKAYVDSQSGSRAVGSGSRNGAQGAGTVTVSGLSFQPSFIQVQSYDSNGSASTGYYDGTNTRTSYLTPATGGIDSTYVIYMVDGSADVIRAIVAATSDGFTLTFSESGTYSGTTHYNWAAFS